MEQINIFRPYIKDLCKQLEQLHKQHQSDQLLTVYRGHANMPIHQFRKIKQNIGTLVSFNGFLSTSINYDVAVMFAGSTSADEVSIIFEIKTNYNLTNVIFADISKLSSIEDEEEVLFSLCSVFRILSVEEDTNNKLWKILMIATDEDTLNLQDYVNQRIQLHECLNIDDSINDEKNDQQINDELDIRVEVMNTNNYLLHCISRYFGRKPIAAMCVIFIIIIATVFVIVLEIKIQSRHPKSNLYSCEGINCTTFNTSTGSVYQYFHNVFYRIFNLQSEKVST
ncbi:unnamed protein product [Adineta steineri]|nr:unnamed protein product [Adineta steineri]